MKGCGTYSIGLGVVAVSLCAAGVALGDIDSRLAWQAWHLVTSTFVLRGRLQHWAGSGGGAWVCIGRPGAVPRRLCADTRWQELELIRFALVCCV